MRAIEAHQRAKDEKHGVVKATKVADQVEKGVGFSRLRNFARIHLEVDLNCRVVETAADLLSDTVVLFDCGSCEKVDRLWFALQETDPSVVQSEFMLLDLIDSLVRHGCKESVPGVKDDCIDSQLQGFVLILKVDVPRDIIDEELPRILPSRYFLPE